GITLFSALFGTPGTYKSSWFKNFLNICLTAGGALSYFGRNFCEHFWEAEMKRNKRLALTALGFFLTGCAGMSKNQAALVAAAACGAGGAGVGAAVAHHGINGE